MFKVNVFYPNTPGSHFDLEYYAQHHMQLVRDLLTEEGLVKTEVNRGVSSPNQPAPYHCVGSLYFRTGEGFERGIAKHSKVLRGDIVNFTDVTPIRQLSEIVENPR